MNKVVEINSVLLRTLSAVRAEITFKGLLAVFAVHFGHIGRAWVTQTYYLLRIKSNVCYIKLLIISVYIKKTTLQYHNVFDNNRDSLHYLLHQANLHFLRTNLPFYQDPLQSLH